MAEGFAGLETIDPTKLEEFIRGVTTSAVQIAEVRFLGLIWVLCFLND